MKICAGLLLSSSIVLGASNLNAADVGVGVKVGTLGIGADFSVTLTETINARVALTTLSIDSQSEAVVVGDSSTTGTIDATADIDFGSSALLFDWHVFDGTFHLTAGLMKADIVAKVVGTLRDSFTVNGQPVAVTDIIGPITGDITLSDSYEPYIGIGWGRKAAADSGLSFSAEIGVVYLDPQVNLNATLDPTSTSGITQAQLTQAINDAESTADNELSDLDLWPVVSIGVNYAF
jgi:hypothetical protein